MSKCEATYYSNNKSHKHIKKCRHQTVLHEFVELFVDMQVIKSKNQKIVFEVDYEIILRKLHYFMIKASIINVIFDFFCFNTKCNMFIIDRLYLNKHLLEYKLKIKEFKFIKIWNIDKTVITFSERIELKLDISELFKEKSGTVKNKFFFYIVENLIVKSLININIIKLKQIKIDSNKIEINSCENFIFNFKFKGFAKLKIKKVVMKSFAIIISFYSNLLVSAIIREKFKNLLDRDFVFNLIHDERLKHENDILFYIVDVNFLYIQIRNVINNLIFMFRRCRLRLLQKYENEKCYLIFSNDAYLAAKQWFTKTKKLIIRVLLTSFEAIKTVLFNHITIYKTFETTNFITKIVNQYFTL